MNMSHILVIFSDDDEFYTNMSGTNLSLEQILSFVQAEKDYLADNSR